MFMKICPKESKKTNHKQGKGICIIFNRQSFGVLNIESIFYKSVKNKTKQNKQKKTPRKSSREKQGGREEKNKIDIPNQQKHE